MNSSGRGTRYLQHLQGEEMTDACAAVMSGYVGVTEWSEKFGLHPDDPAWKTATTLVICNLPARCTLQELSTYLRSLVPDAEMRINLPCAPSGRNKGYAFVNLNEGLPLLVRALWKSSIPTRKMTRILKLQLAKANFAFCQSLSV